MRCGRLRALYLLAAGCTAALAQAQTADVQLAPSPAVACLTPSLLERGRPEYPFAPWKRGEGGRVLVELIFTGPALRPEVKVVETEGDDELLRAVKAYVAAFRVPCIQHSEIPVRLRQEYVFLPDKRRVTWTAPADTADAERRTVLKCMAATDGSKTPDYPDWARRVSAQGNLLAHLRFTAPDQPPAITLHTPSRTTRELGRAVERWTRTLRVPCLGPRPVESVMTFFFRMEGSPPAGFRQIEFMQFLGLVKGRDRLNAQFDTQDMGCPFDVALDYRQPYFPNVVGQVGAPQASRQPLLDWLSTLELELSARQMDAVIGDTARFTVPCVKIDLKPKEKTS